MKNNGFAERLNFALDKEKFPPKNKGRIQLLAEMMGLTHRGASKWINGETHPPAKKYSALAQKLNVSEQWLKEGLGSISCKQKESPSMMHANANTTFVPLYAVEELENDKKTPLKMISSDLPATENVVAIKLESEAMFPRFPSGTIIILDQNKKAKDGDFVLIQTSYYPVPIFRQFMQFNTSKYLSAHNPKFDRLTMSDSDKIIGTMVQAILSFD